MCIRVPPSCAPQDETVLSTVEGLLSSVTISDPLQRGNPLVFASAGFEALTGYVSDEMMGVNCKVLQGKAPDKAKVALLKQGMTDRHFTSVEVVKICGGAVRS